VVHDLERLRTEERRRSPVTSDRGLSRELARRRLQAVPEIQTPEKEAMKSLLIAAAIVLVIVVCIPSCGEFINGWSPG
jgi:hypothetical protein